MMDMAGARRGRISKETLLLCVAGLLMTAFQFRYAHESNAVKALSLIVSGSVVFSTVLLLHGERRIGVFSYAPFVYFGILILSYVVELFFSPDSSLIKAIGSGAFVVYVFLFSYLIFSSRNFCNAAFFLKLLYVNISVYVLINFSLYILGFRRDWSDQFMVDYESGSTVMLGSLGINADRVNFILSNGVNSYGPVTGLLLGLSFLFFRQRLIYPVLLLVALVSSLLIDSRSSIFYPALAVLFSYFIVVGRRWRIGYLLAAFLPFFPFVSELLFSLLGYFLGDQAFLSRNDTDAGSLNGRFIIWASILNVFSEFDLMQVFGYGNAGQVTSGATAAVGSTAEFSNYANPEALSAHNTYLQVLLNYGYVGLVFHVSLLFACFSRIKRMSESGRVFDLNIMAILFVFYEIMLFNNTEVGLIPTGQLFLPFVFLVCFLFSFDLKEHRASRN